MASRKDSLIAMLPAGGSYQITIAEGGELASMRAVLKHGQQITF